MSIRKEYNEVLKKLESISPINYYNNIQLNNLAKCSRLKNKYNNTIMWDEYKPNTKKPYTILNTDDSSKPGTHWISLLKRGNTLYIYDSFARTQTLTKDFNNKMLGLGYKVVYVNKGKDQKDKEVNCGLRCIVWLIFCDKYGIGKARKI